jgi:hypothetical protein
MPEKVTIREDLHVIQVESYGVVSLEDLKGSLEAVARIRQERGYTRVFVDATQQTSFPSTFPVFEFGSRLARRFETGSSPLLPRRRRNGIKVSWRLWQSTGAHKSEYSIQRMLLLHG